MDNSLIFRIFALTINNVDTNTLSLWLKLLYLH